MINLFLILFILLLPESISAQVDSLTLRLKSQKQVSIMTYHSTAGEKLSEPFKVIVEDIANRPIENVPVLFELISHPEQEKGTLIEPIIAFSDSNGRAQTNIVLGKTSGTYTFSASIKDNKTESSNIYLNVIARDQKWGLLIISRIAGGLALFLFGIHLLSRGLKKYAGNKMRFILEKATNNRFVALGVGTFVSMIIQSSSATTVMLISFVKANLMSFSQTLAIILGAAIGTTFTLQLIAFKITDYAMLIIGIGFAIYFFPKSKKLKYIGEVIFGFGILFYGMYIMSSAMMPLRTFTAFTDIMVHLEYPILGILVGTFFSALIQSSAAFLGIVLVLSTQGLVTLEAAIPLILGANMGTSITTIVSSLNSNRDAKRVAIAHTVFRVVAVLLFFWWIPTFVELVKYVSPTDLSSGSDEFLPRQIANAHTIFNVLFAIAFLPFLNHLANLIYRIYPDKEMLAISPYHTKFLEPSLVSTPALALSLAKAEVLDFALKVKYMTEIMILPFFDDKPNVLDDIKEIENEVDYQQRETALYLTKISQQDLGQEAAEESFQILQCSAEFEFIADLISQRLRMLAKKRIKYNLTFSVDGKTELKKFHLQTVKQLARAINVFKDTNYESSRKLEIKYQKYKASEQDLRRAHFDRLRQDIPEAIQTNEMHMELIDLFLRINRHATTIGRIMLGQVELEEEENENDDPR